MTKLRKSLRPGVLLSRLRRALPPISLLMLTVAGIVNAFGVVLFLSPVALYDSGISGTSMLFAQVARGIIPFSLFLIVLNVPLFLYGLRREGSTFTIRSIYTVVIYSLAAAFFGRFVTPGASPIAGSDLLLCAIFGGLISGVGSGTTIRYGGALDGIEVLAVPGPTAMASALSVSGFDTREFAFYGFLPRQKKELREKLLSMKRSGTPIGVVHESPHRVIELVRTIGETLPGCRISASCDLTKLYEKTIRGTAEEVLALLEANEKAEKGEYCLVLDMSGVELETQEEHSAASLEAQLFEEMLSGFDLRQAALTLTERGYKRNDVYRARTNVQRFLDDLMSDYTLEEEDDSDE